MFRNAISVYNPENHLERTVQECCKSIIGRWTDKAETLAIIESMIAYDGLYDTFLTYPQAVLTSLLSDRNGDKYYVPCHIVELRQILKNRKIVSNYKIAGMRWKSATRFLNEYTVLLALDINELEPLYRFDGLVIFDNVLNLGNAVKRVICLDKSIHSMRAVDTITAEEYNIALSGGYTEPPGLSMPKAAHSLKKYIVNIGSLGVKERVIQAVDADHALNDALIQQRERSDNPHDPKFTLKYWKKTQFYPFLVREASVSVVAAQAVKVAQNQIPYIHLTSDEQKIFSFLLSVNEKYQLGLTFRVCGGWVRDHLLGKESDDIDIALDKMTGAQFGEYLKKEIGKGGNVIQANPDQSKHLETMTINLFGKDIDFVNLRTETYGDSRIPEMAFGTPEVDAARRDLTINALFYNLNTQQVEDFTGKGVSDLGLDGGQMVLRTPLDPQKTFMDDPLRIARMLRFFSRYPGSKIDERAVQAMSTSEVQKALKNKVSSERILTEWNKMLAGPQQAAALRILHDTGLWSTLFADKMQNFHPFTMDQKNQHHVDNVLEHTLKVVEEYDKLLRADGAGDDERARMLSAAFFHDLGKLDPNIIGIKETVDGIFNTYHGHEDVSALTAKAIMEGLKASNEDVHEITTVVQHHMMPHQHGSGSQQDISDKKLRKMVRELGRNLVRRIIQHARADATSKPGANTQHYDDLLGRATTIEQLPMKSTAISGNTLMQMFPTLKPQSGYMTYINSYLTDARDGNPNLTEQQMIQMVEQMRNDIETKFTNYTPVSKNKQKSAMKIAQTWYQEMKATGEKPNAVKMLCGVVGRQDRYTAESDKRDVTLRTNTGEYTLSFEDGPTYDDEELERLVGSKICCKGLLDGTHFTISEYYHDDMSVERGQKQMTRKKLQDSTAFKAGDIVRHRHRGLAFSQINGVVKKVEGGLLYIKWDKIEDPEVFRLDDTVVLHGVLQKI